MAVPRSRTSRKWCGPHHRRAFTLVQIVGVSTPKREHPSATERPRNRGIRVSSADHTTKIRAEPRHGADVPMPLGREQTLDMFVLQIVKNIENIWEVAESAPKNRKTKSTTEADRRRSRRSQCGLASRRSRKSSHEQIEGKFESARLDSEAPTGARLRIRTQCPGGWPPICPLFRHDFSDVGSNGRGCARKVTVREKVR